VVLLAHLTLHPHCARLHVACGRSGAPCSIVHNNLFISIYLSIYLIIYPSIYVSIRIVMCREKERVVMLDDECVRQSLERV